MEYDDVVFTIKQRLIANAYQNEVERTEDIELFMKALRRLFEDEKRVAQQNRMLHGKIHRLAKTYRGGEMKDQILSWFFEGQMPLREINKRLRDIGDT